MLLRCTTLLFLMLKMLNIPFLPPPIGNYLFGQKSYDKFIYKCYLKLILENLSKIPILYCIWIVRLESSKRKEDCILFIFEVSVPK